MYSFEKNKTHTHTQTQISRFLLILVTIFSLTFPSLLLFPFIFFGYCFCNCVRKLQQNTHTLLKAFFLSLKILINFFFLAQVFSSPAIFFSLVYVSRLNFFIVFVIMSLLSEQKIKLKVFFFGVAKNKLQFFFSRYFV